MFGMFTAIIGVAGLAVFLWQVLLAPMARLLDLSEDLAGVQTASRWSDPASNRRTLRHRTGQVRLAGSSDPHPVRIAVSARCTGNRT
jgi:hypothetical protein